MGTNATRMERAEFIQQTLCELRALYLDDDGEQLRYLIGMAAIEADRLTQTSSPAPAAIDVQRLYMADSLD